jgi:hypothetical protein
MLTIFNLTKEIKNMEVGFLTGKTRPKDQPKRSPCTRFLVEAPG